MAVGVCLLPQARDAFKQALVSGKINPEHLANMTSEERHALFSDIVGEGQAKFVNSQFESKLLLKNQQRGFLTWAKKMTGVNPQTKRDLISRIQRMDKFLNPDEEKAFLKDLASTKLGVDVTFDEAKQISKLSSKIQDLESKQHSDGTFASESQRQSYGYAKTDLGQLIGDLKLKNSRVSASDILKNPKQAAKNTLLHPIQTTSKIGGTAKSIKAAFDDSALLRQGWKTALSHPVIWGRNVRKNVYDLIGQGIQGRDMMREATADVVSRPNAKYYEKMGIAPKIEEEFGDPRLIMKIPGIGRIYKTTEVAFNAFMLRNRADLADYYIKLAKKAGVNIEDPKELKSIGRMIGGLTGRGDLGRFEGSVANATNNIFFSPRFIKSQVDTVLHPITGAGGSNFVRKESAKNLIKVVGATAAIFGTIDQIRPGTIELDPRSSNFGKVKIGDTTFDLTGGFASIAILASRLYTHEYKSSNGVVQPLGSTPVTPKGQDLISQFISGKLSPAAQRVWANVITRQEFNGAKPTIGSNLKNLFEPLPASTYTEAKGDPHGANALATEIADAFGISANTNNPASFIKPLTKNQAAFKSKVGDAKYKQATNQINNEYYNWFNSKNTKQQYRDLTNSDKIILVSNAKKRFEAKVYKQYGFKVSRGKSSQGSKSLLNSIK